MALKHKALHLVGNYNKHSLQRVMTSEQCNMKD